MIRPVTLLKKITKGDDVLAPLRPIPEERAYFFFEVFFFAVDFFAAFLAGFFVALAMNYSPIEQDLREVKPRRFSECIEFAAAGVKKKMRGRNPGGAPFVS
ncbi:MAG: hypothetical protein ACRD01_14165 [Terriglobales bacterium]